MSDVKQSSGYDSNDNKSIEKYFIYLINVTRKEEERKRRRRRTTTTRTIKARREWFSFYHKRLGKRNKQLRARTEHNMKGDLNVSSNKLKSETNNVYEFDEHENFVERLRENAVRKRILIVEGQLTIILLWNVSFKLI